MDKGQLIVIDGIDGSGKTTQVDLLVKVLADKDIQYEVISFPRYEDNLYGKLVSRYLEGEFGSINDVNPYLMVCVYAGDRALAGSQIRKWLEEGKLVIVNRYVSASKAHMGANLPAEKRHEFFKWLDELEYQTNGIPKEDLTIILDVDPKVGQKNVSGRADIHEESLRHLEEASKIYLSLAKEDATWYVVDCMKDGGMKAREEIHQEVMRIVYDKV